MSSYGDRLLQYGKQLAVANAKYRGDFMEKMEAAVIRAELNARKLNEIEGRCEVMRLPDGCLDDTRAVECNGPKFIICEHCGVLCETCAEAVCLNPNSDEHEIIWRR